MQELFGIVFPEEEQEGIKELVSGYMILSKADKAVLISNANALRARREIEKARNGYAMTDTVTKE